MAHGEPKPRQGITKLCFAIPGSTRRPVLASMLQDAVAGRTFVSITYTKIEQAYKHRRTLVLPTDWAEYCENITFLIPVRHLSHELRV